MNAQMTFVVGALVMAGLVYLLVLGIRKAKEKRAEEALTIHAFAQQRGWRVETPDSGDVRYRLYGRSPDGVEWTLAFDSDQSSSSSSPKLTWRAEGLKAARTELMIGSRRQWAGFGSAPAKAAFAGARWLLGGISHTVADLSDFFEQATVSPYGSPAFREQFVVAGRTPAVVRAVPERLEGMLLRWPREAGPQFKPGRSVSIWLNSDGLEVVSRIDAPPPAVVDHVVKIATALADAVHRTSYPRLAQ